MSFLFPAFMTRPPQPHSLDVAEPWDEDKTKFKPRLYLQAKTWNYPLLFDCKPSSTAKDLKGSFLPSPCGTFGYVNVRMPRHEHLALAQNTRRGSCWFDGPVVTPALWKIQHGKPDSVWMGITPMEILTQRQGVRIATGTCVVGGLGLGWFLKKIHAKPTVKRIIVVEQSEGLLEWFGREMCAQLPKVSDVICDDVRNHYGKHGSEARYLIDIWEGYGGNGGQAEFDFRRSGGKIWCWGES